MVEWIEITIPIRLYRLVDVSTLVVEWIEIQLKTPLCTVRPRLHPRGGVD